LQHLTEMAKVCLCPKITFSKNITLRAIKKANLKEFSHHIRVKLTKSQIVVNIFFF